MSAVKAALAKGADPATAGQPSMLPRHLDDISLDLVARDFGDGFAKQLAAVPVRRWAGPMPSGIGVHLVRVRARAAAQLPSLDQVRTAVAREWEADQRIRSRDADYRKLRSEYEVVVEAKLPPAPRP